MVGLQARIGELVSLQDQARALLKCMIDDGRLKPGEHLLESRVAEAFGISRSPARLALEELEREALVTQHPVRGYQVAGCASGPLAQLERVTLSQPRLWERMYSEIEQALYAHSLFGTVQVNDVRLAEHFGVSRTATRDVLARMHGLGLIVKDEAGHWVANRVTAKRVHDLFELRQIIEPVALIQAAPQLPAHVLHKVRGNLADALTCPVVDSVQFDQVEKDLHVTILSFATNEEFALAAKRAALLFGPSRHLVDPLLGIPNSTIKDALQEHVLIIDALLDTQTDLAVAALRTHIAAALDRWLERLERAAVWGQPNLPAYLKAVSPF